MDFESSIDSLGRTLTPNGDVSVTPAGWRAEIDLRELSLNNCDARVRPEHGDRMNGARCTYAARRELEYTICGSWWHDVRARKVVRVPAKGHARFSPTRTVAQYRSVCGSAMDCRGEHKPLSRERRDGQMQMHTIMKQTTLYTLRGSPRPFSTGTPVHATR